MMRYLIVTYGRHSREWLFVAVTAHYSDAVTVAAQWYDSQVWDLTTQQRVTDLMPRRMP